MTDLSPAISPPDEALLERLRVATRGEYDVYGELGRGGMATVYLAHEIALDRKVAIKVMSPGLVHGAGMVERFKREARTAAHLSHPNIIPIYAVREADGLLFFVMKLVEGTPLDAIIKELGKLPLPMVEAILAQVGGAFGYAHRHGVVHRDIKPSNILIDDEGWAVVTDFGIAKVQETEGLTLTGMAVGTPTYMSPEQCGGGVITGASDQYALGVVAYEMLAGRAPFTGANMMALMYSHYHETVMPLEHLRPDCPEPIRRAVMRMLEKDPAARWPSMEEAVAALGTRQLAHDDPTRSQLISLAKTGLTHRIVSQVQTPRSPIPLARKGPVTPAPLATPAPGTAPGAPTLVAASDRRWILLSLVAVVLAGIALAVILFRRPGPAEVVGTPPAGPGTGQGVPPAAAPLSPPPAAPEENRPAGSDRVARPSGPSPRPEATRTLASGSAVVPPGGTPETSGSSTGPIPAASANPAASQPAAPAPSPAPTPAPAPVVQQPPPESASTVTRNADDRAGINSAIMAYGAALDRGDLALARQLNPGMTTDQRQGFQDFFKAGGTMQTHWTIGDIVVRGDEATALVQGRNLITLPKARPREEPVSLRARLERRAGEWRLAALVN